MKIVDARNMAAEQMLALMTKPAFDSVQLSPKVKAGVKKVFGEELDAYSVVRKIVQDVRDYGDTKLLYYTKQIDMVELTKESMLVSQKEFEMAEQQADKEVVAALEKAIANVRKFHEEQMPKTWLTFREHGSMLGQKVTPLDCVGIYVPGGTAAYPSSVVMNAVPASVAGVKQIVMCVPPGAGGKINPYVLVAAKRTGVTKVFKAGGAQAVAAMAFGSETIPKVDKITGPGNIFVTLAKKEVYGYCDIDMLAGPSEILIVADESAEPAYLAADLLSQAEHDPLASAILVTDSMELAQKVDVEVKKQLAQLPRQEITRLSLDGQGMIVVAKDIETAAELSNLSAPEHLEVVTKQPFELLPKLRHAGAIFLGPNSPEPLGDYYAGPNHVLPTGGTAKFYSVLNVETFMKKTSIISYSQKALAEVGEEIIRLAEAEGLAAHANSIRLRMDKE